MPYQHGIEHSEKIALRFSPLLTFGGFCLSGVAGYVNAAALWFFHIPISHMTGAMTRLGADVVDGQAAAALFSLSLIGAFLTGAAASGLIVGATRFTAARRYGFALILEGLSLLLVVFVIKTGPSFGPPVAAFACGLQNGMASSYYGLIIRTTHVTGILTDFGVLLGQFVRHRHVEAWKLAVLGAILAGFLLGSMSGTLAVEQFRAQAFLLPSLGTIVAGTIYVAALWRRRTMEEGDD
jgi:uncharacterized membrane protein YoaK (UPF0700 family)